MREIVIDMDTPEVAAKLRKIARRFHSSMKVKIERAYSQGFVDAMAAIEAESKRR